MRNDLGRVFIIFFLGFISCDSNSIYDEYKTIPNSWQKDNVVSFNITPPDTLKQYNLFVNVRCTNDYKYNNLFLIVEMNFPNGRVITDTLEYKMANPSGELLGKGFTDIKENKLWYKEAIVFNENGNYKVNIQHAMRENGNVKGVEYLEGITDVGFRIESAQINN